MTAYAAYDGLPNAAELSGGLVETADLSVDQPSLWVAQRNTANLRIQVLDVTMSCRVHDSFSQCGRFSARPANFVTEHTRRAKACVLIHGHNLSAARHPIAG